jgi:hypothetical protein
VKVLRIHPREAGDSLVAEDAEDRLDEVIVCRGRDFSKRSADDDRHGELDYVAAQYERLKFFENVFHIL